MTEKRKPKSYSKAFKEETVALVTEQGYSVADAAKAVGIRSNQLYRWKQEQEALKSGSMLNADDKAELLRLRKENKLLRMEKEILKKASAFFAKEMK
jgi:transposase